MLDEQHLLEESHAHALQPDPDPDSQDDEFTPAQERAYRESLLTLKEEVVSVIAQLGATRLTTAEPDEAAALAHSPPRQAFGALDAQVNAAHWSHPPPIHLPAAPPPPYWPTHQGFNPPPPWPYSVPLPLYPPPPPALYSQPPPYYQPPPARLRVSQPPFPIPPGCWQPSASATHRSPVVTHAYATSGREPGSTANSRVRPIVPVQARIGGIDASRRTPTPSSLWSTSCRPPGGLFLPNVPLTRNGQKTRRRADAWRDIIDLWDHGLPEHRVPPLKDWDASWFHDADFRARFAMKYQGRKVVALEFIDRCGCPSSVPFLFADRARPHARYERDEARFLADYGDACAGGHSALLQAIQRERIKRGDAQPRASKYGTPAERKRRSASRSSDGD